MESLAEEAEASDKRHDLKTIIENAKKRGLITTAHEANALKIAVRKRLPSVIDKTGGTKACELVNVQSRWMDVTPAMAELWLQNNFNNRPVSKDTVTAYAREMKRGRWLPNHQGIAFDDQDELKDGQHRLLAIVKSGCTVRLMVTFGLPSKVKGTRMTGNDVVDRGKPRTVADQLKIQHGEKHGAVLSMLVNRLVNICTPERTRKLSVGEVLDVQDLLHDEIAYVIEHRPRAHGLRQAGVLAAFAFAMPCGERVKEMYYNLTTGTGIEPGTPGTPLAQLRAFLVSDEAILLSRGNDRALAELVLQTLMMEIQGRRMAALELSTEGADYFRGLQKKLVADIAAIFELPEDVKPGGAAKAKEGRRRDL